MMTALLRHLAHLAHQIATWLDPDDLHDTEDNEP